MGPICLANLAETIDTTPYTDLTFVILAPRRNLITGVHRKMSLERDKNIFARMRQYAFTSRVAVALEEPDAIAIAEQVSVGA